MNSTEYKIERWDAIYDDKKNMKRPLLYILPDESLIEFSKANENNLYVTMSGTGIDCYDNIRLSCKLLSSSNFPNNRPNFFDKTGYYVIVLSDAIWLGYPNYLGKVIFEGKNNIPTNFPSLTPSSPTDSPTLTPSSLSPTPILSTNNLNSIENFGNLNLNPKSNKFLFILVGLFTALFVVRLFIKKN